MKAITSYGGKKYVHSDYNTLSKWNKLPDELKKSIAKPKKVKK